MTTYTYLKIDRPFNLKDDITCRKLKVVGRGVILNNGHTLRATKSASFLCNTIPDGTRVMVGP
jgi:hypothetical protein